MTVVEESLKRVRAGSSKAQNNEESTYRQISSAILEQRLAPGTKLTEEVLGEIFNVSRSVIRRVLTKLSFEKVVELRPNRGAVVASPTLEEANQVFEARRLVEDAVIRSCVERAEKQEIAALKKLVSAELDCNRTGDRIRWIRLSGEFHIELAKLAGNQLLVDFLTDLVAQTSLAIALYGQSNGSICGDDDHQNIVEAIEAGDAEKAARLMLKHLSECQASLTTREQHTSEDLRAIFSKS